jgi:hypothetical protein
MKASSVCVPELFDTAAQLMGAALADRAASTVSVNTPVSVLIYPPKSSKRKSSLSRMTRTFFGF